MKCPICNRSVRLEDKEAPFCSERCRDVDLGNWATGKYVISTPAPNSPDSHPGEPVRPEEEEEE